MTVNLTVLLVLTTLFIGISNALPKTAYVKLIDLWLIVNLLMPFAEVLLHTIIDVLREKVAAQEDVFKKVFQRRSNGINPQMTNVSTKRKTKSEMMLRSFILIGRVGLPAIYLLFTLTAMLYATSA